MSFQDEFNAVLKGGEGVLRRLSSNPKCVEKTVDILRVLIKCRLESAESEMSKVELASALILFGELYPQNTEQKMTVLKCMCDEIVGVAKALSKDDENARFYAEKLAEKSTPLQSVMLDTIECVHGGWSSRIKSKVEQVRRREHKELVIHSVFIPLYLGSAILFYGLTSSEFTILKCLFALVPWIGQVFCMIECFLNHGFWAGMGSIIGGSVIMFFADAAMTGDVKK